MPGSIVVTLARSNKLVKKMAIGMVRINYPITPYAQLPPAIGDAARAARAVAGAMGLDFGTVDIALDEDDSPYVIDVNTTPYWGSESQGDFLAHLRRS